MIIVCVDGGVAARPGQLGQRVEDVARGRGWHRHALGDPDQPGGLEPHRGLHADVVAVVQVGVDGGVHLDQEHVEVHGVERGSGWVGFGVVSAAIPAWPE